MSEKTQSLRGMPDILPADSPVWQYLERTAASVMASYGYAYIATPVMESTGLFTRSIGEATDIVEKEMYTFNDRNDESISLRPEGTASVVRAMLQHGLLHTPGQKVWYSGPMFRYEKPQRGRMRQFHQIGAEVFGLNGPDIDAELLAMSARLWKELGIMDSLRLEINSLGSSQERQQYREHLRGWLSERKDELDEDSLRRLSNNPMRILDSKNPDMQGLIEAAPKLFEHLGDDSRQHFEQLTSMLDAMDIVWHHNQRLVRGLDYYTHTVFEWVTDDLGAQGTVCAGGRYDGLVSMHGGQDIPGVGFAMGLERLVELLQQQAQNYLQTPDVYLIIADSDLYPQALALAESLRDQSPGLKLISNMGAGSMRAQFKRADRSQAQIALILGSNEWAAGEITIKWLRSERDQSSVKLTDLPVWLTQNLPGK